MGWTFLLALQAAAAPAPAPVPPAPAVIPSAFDLGAWRPAPDEGGECERGGGNDIVVCARRPSGGAYPLEEMARIFETGPARAEVDLGGGVTGRVFVQQQEIGGGFVSDRVMIGIKMPF